MKYLLVIMLLLIGMPAYAQQPQPAKWMTDEERARYEAVRRSGFDAVYNLDYDTAERDFKEIVKLIPNHPGGYQLLAASS